MKTWFEGALIGAVVGLGLLLFGSGVPSQAQLRPGAASPYSYLSAANTNSTMVIAAASGSGGVILKSMLLLNSAGAIYYLKIYDIGSAPTCGQGTPKMRIPILQASSGGVVALSPAEGILFVNGVGFCLTGAIADNDTTNAATGVAMNFAISRR